jgi:hypothetical protein
VSVPVLVLVLALSVLPLVGAPVVGWPVVVGAPVLEPLMLSVV